MTDIILYRQNEKILNAGFEDNLQYTVMYILTIA